MKKPRRTSLDKKITIKEESINTHSTLLSFDLNVIYESVARPISMKTAWKYTPKLLKTDNGCMPNITYNSCLILRKISILKKAWTPYESEIKKKAIDIDAG